MEVFSLKLTAESVKETLEKCLVRDQDAIKKCESVCVDSHHEKVVVDNICIVFGLDGHKYYLDAVALEQSKGNIEEMLLQLPREFMRSAAMGGSSFLRACLDNKGYQWGEHENVDELLALGKAVDFVQTALPMPATLVMVMDARLAEGSQSQADVPVSKNGKTEKVIAIMIIIFSPIILATVGIHMLIKRVSRRYRRYRQ